MVSIRRRRYLGLCTGKSSLAVDLHSPIDNNDAAEHGKPGSVHPVPPDNKSLQNLVCKSESPEPSIQSVPDTLKKEVNQYYPGKEIKRRKRHRRKQYEDQERCIMRGVYFKNMKWQAAIKVDKKQIHLGTVGSQEEAARLYDRAAFMCGRQPNNELPEAEKEELSKYNWEEFLALTRRAINNKKNQRKLAASGRKKRETQVHSDWEQERETGSSSMSEADGDADA